MNLKLTAEELAFRDEMRAFFTTQVPAELRARVANGDELSREDFVTSQQILNAHGLAVPHWPTDWGGKDWTPVQRHIWRDEMQLASVLAPLSFNTDMVGPVIATFGSQDQKRRFLPGTAKLDIWWCQGFSEPEAGSDLASLKTRADRDGQDYVVNGQKTWTTLGQHADWIFCLVRTDPNAPKRQAGISFLLIDMDTPGVTVRPIKLIDGSYEVNEVWFEDVRVPADNLIGDENAGWSYAKFLLGNERTGVARVGTSKVLVSRDAPPRSGSAMATWSMTRCSRPGWPGWRLSCGWWPAPPTESPTPRLRCSSCAGPSCSRRQRKSWWIPPAPMHSPTSPGTSVHRCGHSAALPAI